MRPHRVGFIPVRRESFPRIGNSRLRDGDTMEGRSSEALKVRETPKREALGFPPQFEQFMTSVTIFTTPACVYCKMAKDFFDRNDVKYQEKNVVVDTAARDDMIARSGQLGVPVIDVSGQLVIGFDQGRLKELLGIQK